MEGKGVLVETMTHNTIHMIHKCRNPLNLGGSRQSADNRLCYLLGELHLEDRPQSTVRRDDIPHGAVHMDDMPHNAVHMDEMPHNAAHMDDMPENVVHVDEMRENIVFSFDMNTKPTTVHPTIHSTASF